MQILNILQLMTMTLDIGSLYRQLSAIEEKVLHTLESFSPQALNEVPFEGSWTAGQVAAHVIQANASMVKAICAAGKPAERDHGEKIPELKAIFLHLDCKMKCPEFILPLIKDYKKNEIIADLKSAFGLVRAIGQKVDLEEAVDIPVLGNLTRWEILHFVLYHTIRHHHQLQKIQAAVTA